jgi:hypothetical protein
MIDMSEKYAKGSMAGGNETYGEKGRGVAERTVLEKGEDKDGGGEGNLSPKAHSLYRGALRNKGGGDPALTER